MEKALYDLTKNARFQNALPGQEDDELTILEESIKRDGCQDSIKTWHGTIVDGYTRYDICHRHGIPFAVEEMDFTDEDEAYLWIIQNQLGRRNLLPFVKCELVLPLEDQLRKEALKNQGRRNDLANIVPNLGRCSKSKRTSHQAAGLAGVSHGYYDKAKWLHENADEETLNRLRKDEISINRAYTDLRGTPERRQSPSSKIIQFPSTARHQPDWSAEEEPDWPIDEDEDWQVEEEDERLAETPTSTFDPGPDMDDINAIIREIQDNSRHYADRFIELLSRIQPKDATSENIGFISTTIDSIFTAIKKQIKEVHINEQ